MIGIAQFNFDPITQLIIVIAIMMISLGVSAYIYFFTNFPMLSFLVFFLFMLTFIMLGLIPILFLILIIFVLSALIGFSIISSRGD